MENPEFESDISSESDFYGDEDRVRSLKLTSEQFDVSEWWKLNHQNLTLRALTNTAARNAQNEEKGKRYNPYEGSAAAWQFDESIGDFLKRLPPATTFPQGSDPWIRVANPFSGERLLDHDWAAFKADAEAIIEEWAGHKAQVESERTGKSKTSTTRLLTKDRENIEKKLLSLASETKCTSGKWLLFPTGNGQINSSWEAIARAVAAGQLGTAAKVGTDDGSGSRNGRLICVYTKDFADIEDVSRVLHKLVDLELVKENSNQSIYYKCDAYTHLGISSTNEWGFKASLYRSSDILKKKQRTNL